MRQTLAQLAQRRAELQARSEAQRAELAFYTKRLEPPVHLLGAFLNFAGTLRRSPLILTGVGALLLRTPWRRLARVPKLAWRTWKVVQFVRTWTRK